MPQHYQTLLSYPADSDLCMQLIVLSAKQNMIQRTTHTPFLRHKKEFPVYDIALTVSVEFGAYVERYHRENGYLENNTIFRRK